MDLKYKTLMFITLFIFCIGSVCATDPDDNVDSDSKTKEVSINKFKVGKTLSEKMVNKVKELDKTVTEQGIEIKRLNDKIQVLEESNKKQDIEIQELKDKLNDRDSKIEQLNNDKDKLHNRIEQITNEKFNILKEYSDSPKKADFEQIKKQIDDKDNQIKELKNQIKELKVKIEILNNIFSVSKNDVYNSLKTLTSVEKIQCGKYIFDQEDYLKIPLIKDGKKRIMEYKNKHGKLPKFVTIAGYELPQEKYIKLYNM